jgi:hypothetical protein
MLREPFAVSRLSFFHSALEVPPMESAEMMPEDAFELQLSSNFAQSTKIEDFAGVENRFSAVFNEWLVTDATWGVDDDLELGARLKFAGWADHRDHFGVRDENGDPIVFGEAEALSGAGASERHLGFSYIVAHAKQSLSSSADTELAGLLSVKVPMASKRDLSNAGTIDVNAGLLHTYVHGDEYALHVNVGAGAPLGDQTLFIDSADVDLDPWLFAGVGLTWMLRENLAWGIQLEGNTSSFGDVEFLDGAPLTIFSGVRTACGDWMLEGGGGTGFNDESYDWIAHLAATRRW